MRGTCRSSDALLAPNCEVSPDVASIQNAGRPPVGKDAMPRVSLERIHPTDRARSRLGNPRRRLGPRTGRPLTTALIAANAKSLSMRHPDAFFRRIGRIMSCLIWDSLRVNCSQLARRL